MPLRLLVTPRVTDVDILAGELAKRLLVEFGDRLVRVESGEFWDGSNVRVVLRDLRAEDVERVVRIAGEVERRHGRLGVMVVDVVSEEEVH